MRAGFFSPGNKMILHVSCLRTQPLFSLLAPGAIRCMSTCHKTTGCILTSQSRALAAAAPTTPETGLQSREQQTYHQTLCNVFSSVSTTSVILRKHFSQLVFCTMHHNTGEMTALQPQMLKAAMFLKISLKLKRRFKHRYVQYR